MDVRNAFPAEEFRRRIDRVARSAVARGLDGVLVWSRGGAGVDACGDVLWLTNYYNPWPAVPDSKCWSGQSHCAAIVTADARCTLITNVPSNEWRESLVVCDSFTDEPFIDLGTARTIEEAGIGSGRIGLAGRSVLTVQLYELIRSLLPNAIFVTADDLLAEARRVKSDCELEVIRQVGRVADATMTALLDASLPGVTERQAVAAGLSALTEGGGMPYTFVVASGRTADRYAPATLPSWSDRTLAIGDLWHADIAGAYGGYLFDFARTTVIGRDPDARQLEMIEAAIAAVDRVIEHIEPGRPVGDAVSHGRELLTRSAPEAPPPTTHDYPHLGHTLGLGFEDIWLYEDERRPFEIGWYVAVEAVVARDSLGFAMFEQNVIVTPDGAEVVTHCESRPWRNRQSEVLERRVKANARNG